MRKLHLILLSLVAAVPGGVLCYLLGSVLTIPRHDLWNKPLLGGAVVATGLMVLVLAVVWPLLYAIAFYDDPNKGKTSEEPATGDEGEPAGAEDEESKAARSESFEEEDIGVFEREGVKAAAADDDVGADDFEEASEGSEFDLDEESIDTAETADFDLGDDEFADLDMDDDEDEEEEAPKKKAKAKAKPKPSKAKKKKK